MTAWSLVLTCEHGGNRVPPRYARAFATARARAALQSHRGFDPGALALARKLASALGTTLIACTQTRLLIEPNRSSGHPRLYSEFSARLSDAEREALRHGYLSHWQRVGALVQSHLDGRRGVLHLAVHSFAPRLFGETRTADVGLLYDPQHSHERALCSLWQTELQGRVPGLRVRRNYPYRGASDGLTTQMRRRFGQRYLGVELEVNQALLLGASAQRACLTSALVETLGAMVTRSSGHPWGARRPRRRAT